MAKNYKHSGTRVEILTASGAITSGVLVAQEKFIGVALTDIASGESGWIQLTGVWNLPVDTGVVRGDLLYADTGGADQTSVALITTSTTNTFVGVALTSRDAAGNAQVLLNGRGQIASTDV